jgi:hypothetical protein
MKVKLHCTKSTYFYETFRLSVSVASQIKAIKAFIRILLEDEYRL